MKPQEYVINGKKFVVEILSSDGKTAEVKVNGITYRVEIPSSEYAGQAATPPPPPAVQAPPPSQPQPAAQPAPPRQQAPKPSPSKPAPSSSSENSVVSPMPGTILKILVEPGQAVQAGEPLLILEAMKMENEIHAPKDGTVKTLHVSKGAEVQSGSPLVEIE